MSYVRASKGKSLALEGFSFSETCGEDMNNNNNSKTKQNENKPKVFPGKNPPPAFNFYGLYSVCQENPLDYFTTQKNSIEFYLNSQRICFHHKKYQALLSMTKLHLDFLESVMSGKLSSNFPCWHKIL